MWSDKESVCHGKLSVQFYSSGGGGGGNGGGCSTTTHGSKGVKMESYLQSDPRCSSSISVSGSCTCATLPHLLSLVAVGIIFDFRVLSPSSG